MKGSKRCAELSSRTHVGRAHSTTHTPGTVLSAGRHRDQGACSWQDSIKKANGRLERGPTDPTKALHPEHVKTHHVAKRQTIQLQKVGRRREQTLQQACTLAADGHGRRCTLSSQKPRVLEAAPQGAHGRTSQRHVQLLTGGQLAQAPRKRQLPSVSNGLTGDPGTPPQDTVSRNAHVYTQRHVERVTALSCGLTVDATMEHTSLSRRSRATESSLHLRQAQNWQGCHWAEEGMVGGQATPSSPRHWHWHPSVRAQSLQGVLLCVSPYVTFMHKASGERPTAEDYSYTSSQDTESKGRPTQQLPTHPGAGGHRGSFPDSHPRPQSPSTPLTSPSILPTHTCPQQSTPIYTLANCYYYWPLSWSPWSNLNTEPGDHCK